MNTNTPNLPDLESIRAAAETLRRYGRYSPLLRLNEWQGPGEIYLKLENLQPIGAYKIRSMANLLLNTSEENLRHGVYTASSGNAGLAMAWVAQQLGTAARVYATQDSPKGKLEAIRRYGGDVHELSEEDWWSIIKNQNYAADPGMYADAVRNPLALAGNATIGLEILEQLPDVDTVIMPFGGGGLACGIAAALRALKPDTRLIVAESAAASPLTAAFEAGHPVSVSVKPSFISGAGAPYVLNEMWPLLRSLIDETQVVAVKAVANAIRHMVKHNHIVAEGAGAIAVAAAMNPELANDVRGIKTVCIVSGGNIDTAVLASILAETA